MHRTQLLLDDWQYEALRREAAAQGTSISALVRRLVRDRFDPPAARDPAKVLALKGMFSSGQVDHDAVLYDALQE